MIFYLQSTSSLMDLVSLNFLSGGYCVIQRYNAMLLFTIWPISNPVDSTSKKPRDVESLYFHVMSHGGLQSDVQVYGPIESPSFTVSLPFKLSWGSGKIFSLSGGSINETVYNY